MSAYEGEIVRHWFGRRFRFYLGHTSHATRRLKHWDSGTSRGVYLVPWSDRVIGIQWRVVDGSGPQEHK